MARRSQQTAAGAALYDVMVETAAVFFRMRAAGKKAAAVSTITS